MSGTATERATGSSRLDLSALTPDYDWNTGARRYVNARSRRFVPASEIRGAVDIAIRRSQGRTRSIAEMLVGGDISVAEWQRQMSVEVNLIHLLNGAAANGGWAQLTAEDVDRIAERIERQYEYLSNFAKQVVSREQPLGPGLVQRAMMYSDAGRATYEEERRRLEEAAGMTEERNILGPADHCPGCLDATRAGWVAVGTLTPVGSRTCLTSCHCTMEYRASQA